MQAFFVKNFCKSYYTWDNSKEAIEARTQAISNYLTKELQDLNTRAGRKISCLYGNGTSYL
uniref:conjugal transfer protein n=1 Tax=Thomasclavelia ramosa TaxID=1547 RepID=UPI00402A7A0C